MALPAHLQPIGLNREGDVVTRFGNLASLPAKQVMLPNNLTIYARTTGNDANDGLSATSPVQTIQRAAAILNTNGSTGQPVIDLGAGDFQLPSTGTGVLLSTGLIETTAPLVIRGALTLYDTANVITVIAVNTNAGTATSNMAVLTTTANLTSASATLDGFILLLTSGVNSGTPLFIHSQTGVGTTNTLRVTRTRSVFTVGDTFDLYRIDTRILAPISSLFGDLLGFIGSGDQYVLFAHLALVVRGGQTLRARNIVADFRFCQLLHADDVDGTAQFQIVRTPRQPLNVTVPPFSVIGIKGIYVRGRSALRRMVMRVDDVLNITLSSFTFGGFESAPLFVALENTRAQMIFSTCMFTDTPLNVGDMGYLFTTLCHVENVATATTCIAVARAGSSGLDITNTDIVNNSGGVVASGATILNGIRIFQLKVYGYTTGITFQLANGSMQLLDCSNNTTGIACDRASNILMTTTTSSTINTGTGLSVGALSRVAVTDPNTGTTISGTGVGAVKIGAKAAAVTWANINTGTDTLITDFQDGVVTVPKCAWVVKV